MRSTALVVWTLLCVAVIGYGGWCGMGVMKVMEPRTTAQAAMKREFERNYTVAFTPDWQQRVRKVAR